MKHSILALALIFCSCVNPSLQNGLDAMKGGSIETAFAVLGYPEKKMQFGDRTVYYWSSNAIGPYGVQYEATVQIAASKSGIIQDFDFNGTNGSLAAYDQKMQAYLRRIKNGATPAHR